MNMKRLLDPQTGQWYEVPVQQQQAPQNPYLNANNPIGMYGYNNLTQQQPQQSQPQANTPQYTGRAAANIEEVRATAIMPNTYSMSLNRAAGEIYLAYMNNDGAKDILTFILKLDAPTQEQTATQPTQADLAGVYERLDEIKNLIGLGAVTNEPYVDDASNATDEKRGNTGASRAKSGAKQSASSADVANDTGKI